MTPTRELLLRVAVAVGGLAGPKLSNFTYYRGAGGVSRLQRFGGGSLFSSILAHVLRAIGPKLSNFT